MCIVCHSDTPVYNEQWDLYVCTCGFVWQPISDEEIIDYDVDYYEKYSKYPLKKMSQIRADYVEKYVRGTVSSVLDVGFGTGDFLAEMHDRGYATFGIEINEASWCEGPTHIIKYTGAKMGVTTFYDSLEHIPNINELITSLNTEYLVVSIPNFKGIENIENWRHYRPGEHIYYFNVVTLSRYLARFDYELIESDFPEDEIRDTEEKNILTAVFKYVGTDSTF